MEKKMICCNCKAEMEPSDNYLNKCLEITKGKILVAMSGIRLEVGSREVPEGLCKRCLVSIAGTAWREFESY